MAKKMPSGFKDPRKKVADKAAAPVDKASMKISKRGPLNSMSVGAAGAPQDSAMGLRMAGMKKGGSCGSMKGYAKGGAIDGVAKKGHTKGKIC